MTQLYLELENTLITKSFEGTIKQPPNLSKEFHMFGDAYGTIVRSMLCNIKLVYRRIPLHHKQKFSDWTNQQSNTYLT